MQLPFYFFQNLILIGMPSSGKTYLGNYLGKALNLPVIDTEELIHPQVPPTTNLDWYAFRKQEQKLLMNFINEKPFPKIICTGDGCIENHQVFSYLLNRPQDNVLLHIVSDKYRKDHLSTMYEELWMKRGKYYFQLADYTFWNHGDAEEFVQWYHQEIEPHHVFENE